MDVFISELNYRERDLITEVRRNILGVCLSRWIFEPGANIQQLIQGDRIASEFQRERRILAESIGGGPYYILADDDCLLETSYPYIDRAMEIMNRHPAFAILSWWPINANIVLWTPPDEERKFLVNGTHYDDAEVTEHVSVGGIRLCRKGVMKDWLPMNPGHKSYDMIHCSTLRKLGWRSGYFKRLRMLHLGKHYSMISNPKQEMMA